MAIIAPDGELTDLFEYPGLRHVRPVGGNRVALSYRVGHATGWALGTRDDRFTVLCKLGEWHWAECFDAEELREEETAPGRMASDSSVGVYTRRIGQVVLRGDSVEVHTRFEWMLIYPNRTLGQVHQLDLGTQVVRLP